ncbi:MAG: tetratricopeptide repeat protein [Pyrinomonadaceae bacterium]|nr:tetratricopeptide repeat protein [Pyrinomonadaceae bacterium]
MNKQINSKNFEINKFGLMVGLVLMTICLSGQILAQKAKPKPKPKPKTAPTQTNSKNSAADKLLDEGIKLFEQGTKESLEAAASKFDSAVRIYQGSEGTANALMLLGRTYKKLNDLQTAFRHYNNALVEYQSINNTEGKAAALNNMGGVMRDLGKFSEALGYYQQSLPLMRQTNNKKGEAQTLNGIGECYFNLGNGQQALQNFQQADSIWQSLDSNEDKVRTTYNLGRIAFAYNEIQQGLNYLNKALNESRQFDNPILEGDILEALAAYYNATGDLTKAIDYRRQIFNAYSNAKASLVSVTRILLSVNNLQVSYYRAGDFQNALQLLDNGIRRGEQAGEIESTAFLIGNKGVLLTDQGKYEEAMKYLNQGITVARQSGNKYSEAYFLASLGIAYAETGEYQEGINYLNQALQTVPAGTEPETEGKVIAGLIAVYAMAGDKNKSNQMIQLAMTRNIDKGVNAGSVMVIYTAGLSALMSGQAQQALQYFNQAFLIANKLNHEVEKNRILVSAADAYAKLGDYQNSFQSAQKSHDFYKKIGNDWMDMKTHSQMGEALLNLGQSQQAIDNFNSAIGFAQKLGDKETQILSLFGLGMVYRNSQDYANSLQCLTQALNLAEETDDKDSQKFVLNEMGNIYEKSGDKKKAKEFRDKAKKIKN